MHQRFLKGIKKIWEFFFIKPIAYDRKILSEIPRCFEESDVSTSDILGVVRLESPSTWNVSSVLVHIIPHKMEMKAGSSKPFVIWGYRSKGKEVKSYTSCPGHFIELVASDGKHSFVEDGRMFASGGDIFAESFEFCTRRGRVLKIVAPTRVCEWNSGWQKPSHIIVMENDIQVARLIMQPFRDDVRAVESFSLNLEVNETIALVSLAVVLNAKFIG